MRIVKIKNRKLFKPDYWNAKENRPYTEAEKRYFLNSSHFYAVYYDRKAKEYRYVPTTHLYDKDESKFAEINAKTLQKEKFSFAEVPSGVKNGYRTKDKYGKKFTPNSSGVKLVSTRHLSKQQAKRIKDFAKNSFD